MESGGLCDTPVTRNTPTVVRQLEAISKAMQLFVLQPESSGFYSTLKVLSLPVWVPSRVYLEALKLPGGPKLATR